MYASTTTGVLTYNLWCVLASFSVFSSVIMCMHQRRTLHSTWSSESTSLVGERRKGPEYFSDVPPTFPLLEWSFCSHSRDGASSCSWKWLLATSCFQQQCLHKQWGWILSNSWGSVPRTAPGFFRKVQCGLLSQEWQLHVFWINIDVEAVIITFAPS